MDIERAHRLSTRGNLAAIKRALQEGGTRRSTSRLILEAVVAQYSGDIDGCVSRLARALRVAKQSEFAYVVDLYGPILYMQGRREEAREAVASIKHTPAQLRDLLESFKLVLAARDGKPIELSRPPSVVESNKLNAARTLQRISLAAYYSNDFETALEIAKTSAQALEREGAHRPAAAALSIAYAIHHSVTRDVEEAYRFAQLLTEVAEKAQDASIRITGLVAQFEIAAEIADVSAVDHLKTTLNKLAMPKQYGESFARGIAEALPLGWIGDFEALSAKADMLRDNPRSSRPSLALGSALRSVADAALGDFTSARQHSRNAIGVASFAPSRESAFELRYRRLAKALAAAACVLIGDSVRGSRTAHVNAVRRDDAFDIYLTACGRDWREANRRVRGYAWVVAAARLKLAASRREFTIGPARTLTETELNVLRLLAEGMSAPQAALELDRSVNTIRAHTRSIIAKFEVSGKVSAINFARKAGILS